MPIQVSANGQSVIQKIGIAQELYDWFIASPFTAKAGGDGLKFYHKNHPMSALVLVPLTVNQLNSIQNKTMPPSVKASLSEQITSALVELGKHELAKESSNADSASGAMAILKNVKASPANAVATKVITPDAAKTPAFPKPSIVEKTKLVSVAETGMPNFPLDQIWAAPTTKLRDANQMYQPVSASSPGSRYFVVAATSDIRIAARYKDNTLSIRIEGDGYDKIKGNLQASGIDAVNPDYASVHLVCPTIVLARKTLGAILSGLELNYTTPIPNVEVFAEK